jgi:alkanesulfonate monooxygenase SsuD/methylene tetrahydromethanopterin reductase-like flavin-dependent oxidoreductase (luciferase family)
VRFAVLHHLESGEDGLSAADLYAEVTGQVRLADELGYEIAWVAEHHFSPAKGRAPEPLLLLVHMAAQTRRIRVGSAVLPAPFYQPLRLAESVAMADTLTGGRLACGISSSAVPDEMRVFGAAQEGKHERLRESLLWLRRAWTEPRVEVPGTDDQVAIVPAPLQPLDEMVWVAASSHGAARVAGELGYHLLLPSLRPRDASAEHAATYRAALDEFQPDVAPRNIQLTMHLVLEPDHDAAMRTAEPIVRAYYERYTRSGAVQPIEAESLPAIMRRINFVAGGPEAVAEQIAEVGRQLPLTHVAFQSRLIGLSDAQVRRGLELAMSRVAPLLAPAAAGR